MQRNIQEDRPIPRKSEPEQTTSVITTATASKEQISPAPTPVYIKKRKSSGTGGLLSFFKSKKPKPTTEQQGPSTVAVPQTSAPEQPKRPVEEKPIVDYAILPNGKRLYIDIFRDRPGLNMAYKPDDFENRYVLPVVRIISIILIFSFPFLIRPNQHRNTNDRLHQKFPSKNKPQLLFNLKSLNINRLFMQKLHHQSQNINHMFI